MIRLGQTENTAVAVTNRPEEEKQISGPVLFQHCSFIDASVRVTVEEGMSAPVVIGCSFTGGNEVIVRASK